MTAARDLTGQRFGHLMAISREGSKGKQALWRCQCDCGRQSLVIASNLANGNSGSCGCRPGRTKHGHTSGAKSPTYSSWQAMIARCTRPGAGGFEQYGGAGVRVCHRWRFGDGAHGGFECFLADMGERPSVAHSIDRFPNPAGNYEPGNCRWATKLQQQNNRLVNTRIPLDDGRVVTVAELARECGIPRSVLSRRLLNLGWSVAEATTKPVEPRRQRQKAA